ncbi:S1 family peptidase [Chondromyces crocatus]|uniref:trypsin n=1 Tax=Chondromyces crocatus TaxID=52 RepID=A0A0K1E897_CHOCO|nr:trypsin-like serine protease [Chondromyces crocatus]AKT37075.1 peptidase [Chondromyces crocatus]
MLLERVRAGLRLPPHIIARSHAGTALILSATLAGCAFAAAPDDAIDEVDVDGEVPVESASFAIEGGYAAASDHAVVGLAVIGPSGRLARTCTGALIAPDLVITAQHCVATAPELIRCDRAKFGPTDDAVKVHITTSDDMWSSGATWTRGRELLLPPYGRAVCGHDLALIVLESPLSPEEATPLDLRLDRTAEDGEPYSAVGFGNTSGAVKDAGKRRRRDGLQVECVGYRCGDSDEVALNEWRGNAGACSGDSGGPALDRQGRILGITSRGPDGCDDPIYGGLVEHREWLTEAALRLAEEGDYEAPDWTDGQRDASARYDAEHIDPRWTSCAVSVPVPGRSGGTMAAVAIAVLGLALLRRQSNIPS